jgi:hypothetical protein
MPKNKKYMTDFVLELPQEFISDLEIDDCFE